MTFREFPKWLAKGVIASDAEEEAAYRTLHGLAPAPEPEPPVVQPVAPTPEPPPKAPKPHGAVVRDEAEEARLRKLATAHKVTFDKRWGIKKLRAALIAAKVEI